MSRLRRWFPDRGAAILFGLMVAIVVGFYWQRSCSSVLRIERQGAAVGTIAAATGLDDAQVMALWESVGAEVPAEQIAVRAQRFAADRVRFEASGLALLPQLELRSLALALWQSVGEDSAAARAELLRGPQAWRLRRFEHMVERFETRLAATR